jgi:hypothetical protein
MITMSSQTDPALVQNTQIFEALVTRPAAESSLMEIDQLVDPLWTDLATNGTANK